MKKNPPNCYPVERITYGVATFDLNLMEMIGKWNENLDFSDTFQSTLPPVFNLSLFTLICLSLICLIRNKKKTGTDNEK